MKGEQQAPAQTVVSIVVPSEVWARVDRRIMDVDGICSLALAAAVDIIEHADDAR